MSWRAASSVPAPCRFKAALCQEPFAIIKDVNNLFPIFFALLLAAPAAAAPSLESAKASAEQSFRQPRPSFKLSLPKPVPKRPMITTQYRSTRVSGYIDLHSNSYVPNTPGFVNVDFSGYANICDSTGKICTGYIPITFVSTIFINDNFVSAVVRPDVPVSFYKDGRYIGTTQLTGNIPVSGWLNAGWARLNGYGALTGDLPVP